jgi:hypothetical protein
MDGYVHEPKKARPAVNAREFPSAPRRGSWVPAAEWTPLFDVSSDTAGSGRYAFFIRDLDRHYQGYGPTDSGFHRRPIYLVAGRYEAGADQPVWFEEPKFFMDHDGTPLGTPGRRGRLDLALYSSFTVRHDRAVLWYPDRRFFLLGKIFEPEKWFGK